MTLFRALFTAGLVASALACGSTQTPTPAPAPSAPSPASAAPAASAPVVTKAPEASTKGLIGTWEYQGAKLTFNSKGRVRMHHGDPPCLGGYSVEGQRLAIKYDPDTKGCTWNAPVRLEIRETELDLGPVTYKRMDAKDDASF